MTTATLETTDTEAQAHTATNTPAGRALRYKLNVRRLVIRRLYDEHDLRYVVARAQIHDRVAPNRPLRKQVRHLHRQWLALLKEMHMLYAPQEPPSWLLAMADCPPHLAHTVFQRPTKTTTGKTVYTAEARQGQTCGYRICPYCAGRRCSALVKEVIARGGESVPVTLIGTQVDVSGITAATLKAELNRIKRTVRRRLDRQPERRGRPVWLAVYTMPSILDPAKPGHRVHIHVLVAGRGPALRPATEQQIIAGHHATTWQHRTGPVRDVLPGFAPYPMGVFEHREYAAALIPRWLTALRGYQPIAQIAAQ